MHCPFTSEISVKRERGILILVMRYFYWLFLSRCRYVRRTPPPPPFTPLFVHCCVQECSFYFWYFSSKLDVSRVVSIGFLNEEFYLLYRYWWNTRNIFLLLKIISSLLAVRISKECSLFVFLFVLDPSRNLIMMRSSLSWNLTVAVSEVLKELRVHFVHHG